jgi:NADPH2:quinone reductase
MSETTNLRIVVARRGPPSACAPVEEPIPQPGPGDVRVRVAAAGVAWADVMMREGIYPGTRFPLTPGYDIVGTVDTLGEGVTGAALGDNVAALTVHGGYARYVVLGADELVPVPNGLDPAEAVSLVLNYVTAYQMLHRCVRLDPGDTILVHGAAGGVGTALLQLAKLAGIRAIGTASAGKHELVARLGATPLDYRSDDVRARVRELSGGGVHAAFDPVGGVNWARSYAALRQSGTLVAYGASTVLSGGRLNVLRALAFVARTPRYAPSKLLADAKGVVGYNIGHWKNARPAAFRADLTTLLGMLARREIEPIVAERIPLAEAARAHELLGEAKVTGKIVLI